MLIDGRAFWACSLDQWASKRELVQLAVKRAFTLRAPSVLAADAEPAPTYVNHGRVFAKCWSRGCGGAELVWLDNPRMWCTSCGNAELSGFWRPVALPSVAELEAVDALLSERAEPERNWGIGESIDNLRVENALVSE